MRWIKLVYFLGIPAVSRGRTLRSEVDFFRKGQNFHIQILHAICITVVRLVYGDMVANIRYFVLSSSAGAKLENHIYMKSRDSRKLPHHVISLFSSSTPVLSSW